MSFPTFWGVLSIAKCFSFFVSVIGSAVFEISRFARFYVKRTNHLLSVDVAHGGEGVRCLVPLPGLLVL